jgi:hypothetical protein
MIMIAFAWGFIAGVVAILVGEAMQHVGQPDVVARMCGVRVAVFGFVLMIASILMMMLISIHVIH